MHLLVSKVIVECSSFINWRFHFQSWLSIAFQIARRPSHDGARISSKLPLFKIIQVDHFASGTATSHEYVVQING